MLFEVEVECDSKWKYVETISQEVILSPLARPYIQYLLYESALCAYLYK